jgi:superfamily II DNA or RNA helicase
MLEIIITNKLALRNVPERFREMLIGRLTFKNPKWEENEKYGYWQGDTDEWLRFYEFRGEGLVIPRGFIRQLIYLCKKHNIRYHLVDNRRALPDVEFQFTGRLRSFQAEATNAMAIKDFGTLSAPTGSGKTIMALWLIAQRKQPALIVVHTKELLGQWIARIETYLGIPAGEVGRIGNGKCTIGDKITVALVQTLYKVVEDTIPHIGHLIVDECHRTPSRTFTEAVTAFDCKFMLGLSATPWRRDRLSKLIFWCIGDVIHEVDKADLIESGDVLPAEVVIHGTDFRPYCDPSTEYVRMLSELTEDPARNELIVKDVAREVKNGGGICLVLSDRKSHCETILGLLARMGVKAELLTGGLTNGERRRVVEDLNAGKVKVLVATGQLIGEGFDCKELSTLFLVTPIKFDGRLLQYLGRVLRPAPGKDKAQVFDYVDINVGVLKAAARGRHKVYN